MAQPFMSATDESLLSTNNTLSFLQNQEYQDQSSSTESSITTENNFSSSNMQTNLLPQNDIYDNSLESKLHGEPLYYNIEHLTQSLIPKEEANDCLLNNESCQKNSNISPLLSKSTGDVIFISDDNSTQMGSLNEQYLPSFWQGSAIMNSSCGKFDNLPVLSEESNTTAGCNSYMYPLFKKVVLQFINTV